MESPTAVSMEISDCLESGKALQINLKLYIKQLNPFCSVCHDCCNLGANLKSRKDFSNMTLAPDDELIDFTILSSLTSFSKCKSYICRTVSGEHLVGSRFSGPELNSEY